MKTSGNCSLFLAIAALGLTACTAVENPQRDFERMNSAELLAYNRTVDFWDQIYCVSEVRAGSHIKRRHCSTLYEIQTQVDRSASEVNVLSASRVY